MRAWVAQALVMVAFGSTASAALADVRIVRGNMVNVNDPVTGAARNLYWSAHSEYYVPSRGDLSAEKMPPRHILITGYHPIAGFEAETAAEAAMRDRGR